MNKTPEIALLLGMLAMGFCLNSASLYAKTKKDEKKPAKKTNEAPDATGKSSMTKDGYTHLATGLEYKIATHGTGKRKPEITDHVELHISYRVGDSVMFDSRKMNNNKPVPLPIAKPRGAGDPVEVFMLMVVGDSAVIRYPVDSLKKWARCPHGPRKGI